MVAHRWSCFLVLALVLVLGASAVAQQAGSIRGVIYDKDFDAPLPFAKVEILELEREVTATEEGNYVISDVPPGQYTLVFAKQGYARQVETNVLVSAGQLTDIDAWLSGEFTEMEEFIVQDLQIGGGTEAGLLRLRMEAPALIDSISAELMSQAGASDVASALNLVTGATVADGKFAVIRGLPDRYVNSQVNGARLPTADEDKRAAQLDQFPAAVVESVRVTKTFTPDQQGDASGGAVNIILKGIPDETIFQIKGELGFNSQVSGRDDFITYDGGGVSTWGIDGGQRGIQFDNIGQNWDGAVGTSRESAPQDYKLSMALGGNRELDAGVTIGGFASFFYERDSAFFDNGIDDSLWIETPGSPMVPEQIQGTASDGDFKTRLFDITQGSESVQWGGIGTAGIETERHSLNLAYLYTRIAEDKATLAENTRGKNSLHQFWPDLYGPEFDDYDPDDPSHPGNRPTNRPASPYVRTHTLEYTERTTETILVNGQHRLPADVVGRDGFFTLLEPELDWKVARSSATLYQPDKRQFGTEWWATALNPGFPPFVPPFEQPALYRPFKPAANFTLGNLQRIWKRIEEESSQYAVNVTLPFEQWTGTEGYLKLGLFDESLTRTFDQDTFSNFNDNSTYEGDWDDFWSDIFPSQDHPISDGPPFVDVDYRGDQQISAWYVMADLPLTSYLSLTGGVRIERTELSIVNFPEENATWFAPGDSSPSTLDPGEADVDFRREDTLPSIAFAFTPIDEVTLRGSYSRTVARQTFKELTPIIQQEFLGGPVFIGNPDLDMSSLENYDLRFDYRPSEATLFSVSYFKKKIEDPIEFVQRVTTLSFTTPVNYPEGDLKGFEIEFRQNLGQLWEGLDGFSVGANATFIDSEVILPAEEAALFEDPAIEAPMPTRDMTNAPEYLYNLYLTYDLPATGTSIGLFYTVRGDTLVAGATAADENLVPNIYEKEFDTLNFSISQKIGDYFKLQFKAKNLTNPRFEEVYRSPGIESDVLKSSFTKGIDYSISLSAEFTF